MMRLIILLMWIFVLILITPNGFSSLWLAVKSGLLAVFFTFFIVLGIYARKCKVNYFVYLTYFFTECWNTFSKRKIKSYFNVDDRGVSVPDWLFKVIPIVLFAVIVFSHIAFDKLNYELEDMKRDEVWYSSLPERLEAQKIMTKDLQHTIDALNLQRRRLESELESKEVGLNE